MPVIFKQRIETQNLMLLGFHNTRSGDEKNTSKSVHFFLDDKKFDCVWNDTERYIKRLSQYNYVMSPDFSTYTNMPIAVQIFNTFRSRWCSAYWQANGIKVIPSVTWGDERSFDFCFDGIENGSTVKTSLVAI